MDGDAVANNKSSGTDAEQRLGFGRLLADGLKARGMKQEDLARMLGTTQSSVSGWINGKYEPAAATVFAVERCLGTEPGTLSRPLGYLPVEPVARTVSVEAVIAQSPQLDDEAKAALTSLYRLLVARSPRSGERPRTPAPTAKRARLAAAPVASGRARRAVAGR